MASTVGRFALCIVLLIPVACGTSDAGAPAEPKPNSAIATYQTWIKSWRDAAADWSTTWLAATKKLEKQFGPDGLKLTDARDFAGVLSPKAQELDEALTRVGEPRSAAAPVAYVAALRTAARLVGSHRSALRTCTTTCPAEFKSVERVGLALENLVLLTSGVATATSDVTRTAPLPNAILTAEDIAGATPISDQADPLDYLCTPTYETRDAIAELPRAARRGARCVRDPRPLPHVSRPPPVDLAHRGLAVVPDAERPRGRLRAGAAPRRPRHRGHVVLRVSPKLSVPTVQWTASYPTKRGTQTARVAGALVDDTVVLVLVRSVGELPSGALVQSLLTKEIRKLGVDPTTG